MLASRTSSFTNATKSFAEIEAVQAQQQVVLEQLVEHHNLQVVFFEKGAGRGRR